MKNAFIFLSFLFLMSCNHSIKKEQLKSQCHMEDSNVPDSSTESVPKLTGSHWEYKFDDGCTIYYQFLTDTSYIFSDTCEIGGNFQGTYKIKEDTLILDEIDINYDASHPNINHRRLWIIFKENQKMTLVKVANIYAGKEKIIKEHFDEDFFYKQVK